MEKDCIFCSLSRENPRIITESEHCYVIPSLFPLEYGHMLVISRDHSETMLDAPDRTIAEMFVTAKKMGILAKERLGAIAISIATNAGKEAGQEVPHFHIHVIPKYPKPIEGFVMQAELDSDAAAGLLKRLKS